MTCKDCLHCKVCATSNYDTLGAPCKEYADKSAWVHLPCKAGDAAYLVNRHIYKNTHDWYIDKITIGTLYIEPVGAGEVSCYIEADHGVDGGYLGTTAFLAREEAEKALEERRAE